MAPTRGQRLLSTSLPRSTDLSGGLAHRKARNFADVACCTCGKDARSLKIAENPETVDHKTLTHETLMDEKSCRDGVTGLGRLRTVRAGTCHVERMLHRVEAGGWGWLAWLRDPHAWAAAGRQIASRRGVRRARRSAAHVLHGISRSGLETFRQFVQAGEASDLPGRSPSPATPTSRTRGLVRPARCRMSLVSSWCRRDALPSPERRRIRGLLQTV